MPHGRSKRRSKLRSLYVWHRYLGVAASLLVLILVLSGVALNHTERLDLDSRYVTTDWLLDWYGVAPPAPLISYETGTGRVTQLGRRLFIDRTMLPGDFGPLLGAVMLDGMLLIAVDSQLLLLTPEGALIERLTGAHGVPSGMRRIGTNESGDLVVLAAHGYYAVDKDFLRWRELASAHMMWVTPSPPPEPIEEAVTRLYRGADLPLERVVLDMHSGRILGPWGVYVIDAAALLLAALACTGVVLWIKGLAHRRRHRRQHLRKVTRER